MASPIGSSTTESIDATIVSQGTVSRASVYSSQEDLKTTVYSTSLHQTSSQTFASSLPSSSPIIVLVSIDQGASNNPLNFPVVIVLAVVGTIVALCLITVTVITALLLAKARRSKKCLKQFVSDEPLHLHLGCVCLLNLYRIQNRWKKICLTPKQSTCHFLFN